MERDVTPSYVAVTSAISTHTLTWSVTTAFKTADIASDNFNSHAHVERDAAYSVTEPTLQISTHTLTWSVTYKMAPRDGVEVNFNSHAHVERDRLIEHTFYKS